jgi:hypothetical protein
MPWKWVVGQTSVPALMKPPGRQRRLPHSLGRFPTEPLGYHHWSRIQVFVFVLE